MNKFKRVRTRFAPSPTGFLHIGSARTALFAWAYARKLKGDFVLRIEDTDIERSTQDSVSSILDAMHWLGLDYDEGPFYQTRRLQRYQEVINQLIKEEKAYYCYCSKDELETMRNEQKAHGLKPKYDRRCLYGNPKVHANPVVRFKNQEGGSVIWQDLVKGRVEINNSELDDLIIARSDGTPTYNFCVVVDDWDMNITHVIRGDDHVNNTPRQINLLMALGADIPQYAHLPMILGEDGHKMSKRTDAVSVMEYKNMGILPPALLNYLARLCWSHGDDEIFDLRSFIEWFGLENVSGAAARFDLKKLLWVNAQHMKQRSNADLSQMVQDRLPFNAKNINEEISLMQVVELVRDRVDNLNDLASEVSYFYCPQTVTAEEKAQYLTKASDELMYKFAQGISAVEWSLSAIKSYVKQFCMQNEIKMPQLGMPLRLKLCGTLRTPSFDNIIYILGRKEVLHRMGVYA